MQLTGKINSITYKPLLCKELKNISLSEFDINKISSNINVVSDDNIYALCKWAGPKRSRTYPYAKVYDTLKSNLKIAVIPIIKDEGYDGDFDYLQYDTISLMSLLNVYVILVPFVSALKNPKYDNKITKYKIDNDYVINKIKEIQAFKSPAIHYNANIVENEMMSLIRQTITNYKKISKKTGVKLHNHKYIENFIEKISFEKESFKMFSREKSKKAQNREMLTTQPNESLRYKKKASITIENHLGGLYYFTTDEIYFSKDKTKIFLRESKHSARHKLPSSSDIKDALIKMVVYCNLKQVEDSKKTYLAMPVLRLSSVLLRGKISSTQSNVKIDYFIKSNTFAKSKEKLLKCLIEEAKTNNFEFIIEKS